MCRLANDFIAATIIFFFSGLCIIILDERSLMYLKIYNLPDF